MTGLGASSISIIGAGIAGLTAACALARHGAQVTVLERAPALEETGAGLQLSPNALRVIDALGLWPQLEAISAPSQRVELFDTAGRLVSRLDLAKYRPQDRFRLVHRARLIELLADAACAAGAQITLGHEVTDLPKADLVIGADGIKSRIRPRLNGPETPFFTKQTAWRALIPSEPGAAPASQVFMGPGRHLVSYPLAKGLRNIVAVVERPDWHDEGWSHPGDPTELRAAFAHFGGPVPGWLAQVQQVSLWGLFRHPVAAHWQRPASDGPALVLIGDAAHPTLPFMAQGAVMAIEDAWILADCLARAPMAEALARFQSLRQPRCQRIVAAANGNARNYHMRGPTRAVAHAGLRAISTLTPGLLIERFAWLYDYDPTSIAAQG
ncbi:FAD-dependent oxidoreductase [Paracoccus shanxieyensis]|uniref:FAD-dependent oxidoreductase n=1 Tax=Paracoccus shanxieyensis TaxID=2675752 RepID=A0A6L6ISR9_9RHOB|nr:NAD(P)/FAD-dependent oxidoreductase [Paracoccus shanxieyensis]MTH62648.1 FAD-dependent oxidoreductase [Paracoccus shanxieyensis]MTH86268.1 FAD-dependent oxidoreductase [Paracoccus shanxieyensis]